MASDRAGGPLTPAVLHILLALSTQDRHGYGIMKQVESDSQGPTRRHGFATLLLWIFAETLIVTRSPAYP